MESNFFRCLVGDLAGLLPGVHIQKVFGPAPSVYTFALGLGGENKYLLFKNDPKTPVLFLSSLKPDNPEKPPAQVMRLRKYLNNRRIFSVQCDAQNRRMALELSPGEYPYLILDLRNGPELAHAVGPEFNAVVEWPDFSTACKDKDIWKQYPLLSPPLRAVLAAMEAEDARSLYDSVQAAGCRRFFGYEGRGPGGKNRREAYVWRLPEVMRREKEETVFQKARDAAAFVGETSFFLAVKEKTTDDAKRTTRTLKRLKRSLRKIEAEEEQLQKALDAKTEAVALQSGLYRMNPKEKTASVTALDEQGREMEIHLDPTLTVLENMQRMFKKAAKAERGMKALHQRKLEVHEKIQEIKESGLPPEPVRPTQKSRRNDRETASITHRFRTDDGFTVLRGKNDKANQKLVTRIAGGFDYWFHAADGPGAHCVLRRDYPDQEVPERSMEQAAILAGLKSWCAADEKAEVMCALIKDVRAVKGGKPGMVRVDKVLETRLVKLDPGLEKRLGVG